jgi:hypothetical protein
LLTENSALGDTLFRVLPRLTNLRVLLIDIIRCDDWALQQFAVHATNLVYGFFLIIEKCEFDPRFEIFSVLKVGLSRDVSSAGFKALSTLRHLRQFLFRDYYVGGLARAKECILLCAEYLPHLKGAATFDSKFLSECQHNELVQHQQLSKLSLANLSIGRNVEPHKNLQLPELESLSVRFPMNDVVGLCDRFSTISALVLCDIKYASPETVMTVLQGVGGRLRSLSLIFAPQPLSLAKIFELCPQLESFKIEYCNIIDTPTVCWPENYLSCLNEVSVYRFRDETGRWNSLAVGFIMQVNTSL